MGATHDAWSRWAQGMSQQTVMVFVEVTPPTGTAPSASHTAPVVLSAKLSRCSSVSRSWDLNQNWRKELDG